jgi:hypothetical protein
MVISEETVANEAPAKPGPVAQTAVRFAAVYFTVLLFPWPISALFVSDRLQNVSDLLVSGVMSGVPTSIQLRRNQWWTSLVRHETHWIQDAPREP